MGQRSGCQGVRHTKIWKEREAEQRERGTKPWKLKSERAEGDPREGPCKSREHLGFYAKCLEACWLEACGQENNLSHIFESSRSAVGWKMNSEGAEWSQWDQLKDSHRSPGEKQTRATPITRVPVMYFWKRCYTYKAVGNFWIVFLKVKKTCVKWREIL